MMSGSSIAGPLFFFSSASCRSLSSILENARECRSRNNSESLRKQKLPSWAAEKWRTSRLSSCLCLLFFACPHHSNSGDGCQRVQTFWAIKMLNFFISHSDMMHVKHTEVGGVTRLGTASLARSNRHLQNPIINTLYLVSFIPTNSQSRHGTLRLYRGSCVGLFLGKVQPFPEISSDDIQAKKYFGTCTQSIFLGGYGLSKQSIVC